MGILRVTLGFLLGKIQGFLHAMNLGDMNLEIWDLIGLPQWR